MAFLLKAITSITAAVVGGSRPFSLGERFLSGNKTGG